MATENQVGTLSAASANQRPGFWQRSRDTRTAFAYLLPAGIIMGIITLYPLLFQVLYVLYRL